jgi:hypothetical protein
VDSAALVALVTLASQLEQVRGDAAEARRVVDQRSAEVADLREERGRLTAELTAERAMRQQLLTERDADEAYRRRYARWLSIALAAFGTLVLAWVLAPGWAR